MGWTVGVAKPNCENIAEENLLQQGYGCYFPRYKTLHKNKVVLIRPLFPRYIFIHIDKLWYSIRGTRGISYLLMDDTGPAKVPEAVITSIKAKEDRDGFIILGDNSKPERFAKGQTVHTSDGPLSGLDLIYDGMAGCDRVRVLTSLLGRFVPVLLDEKALA